jgi:hypothetical protein
LYEIGKPLNKLKDGDIFGVSWRRNNGFYSIKGFLNSEPAIDDIEGELTFKFEMKNKSLGSNVINYSVDTRTVKSKGKRGSAIVKWGKGNNLVKLVYPETYPLNMYEYKLSVSDIMTSFESNAVVLQLHRDSIYNDIVENISFSVPIHSKIKLNIKVPLSEDGSNAGAGTKMMASYTKTDGDLDPQESNEMILNLTVFPNMEKDVATDASLICVLPSLKRKFNMSHNEKIRISGARALAAGAANGGKVNYAYSKLFNSRILINYDNVKYNIIEY